MIYQISIAKIRNFVKRIYSSITLVDKFYMILFVSFFVIFSMLRYEALIGKENLISFIIINFTDASILTFLCLLPRGKWKIITLFIPILIFILVYANILYFRNFEDLIPAPFYLSASALNIATFAGASSSFHFRDLILIVGSLLPFIYFLISPKSKFYELNANIYTYSVVLVLVFFSLIFVVRRNIINLRGLYPDVSISSMLDVYFHDTLYDWSYVYSKFGFTGYMIKTGMFCHVAYSPLSEDNKHRIIKRFDFKTKINSSLELPKSIKPPKNLIYIVVESWPSSSFELEDADYIMPNISKLVKDSLTIYGSFDVLAKYGNSSDAQLIYNTGLLPLQNEAFVTFYADNDFPSIAKAFKGTSVEVIGESASMWNHNHTTKSYGFDNLYEDLAKDTFEKDGKIFRKAEEILNNMEEDFLMFITTFSMHGPYERDNVISELEENKLKTKIIPDQNYYKRLNYFDKELAEFIYYLENKGIYDETLLVIVGDHQPIGKNLTPKLREKKVPFIILNSPYVGPKRENLTQLDLFPTILFLMGLKYNYNGIIYTGLGTNMFIENNAEITDEDYLVSQWMIKKNPSKRVERIKR